MTIEEINKVLKDKSMAKLETNFKVLTNKPKVKSPKVGKKPTLRELIIGLDHRLSSRLDRLEARMDRLEADVANIYSILDRNNIR